MLAWSLENETKSFANSQGFNVGSLKKFAHLPRTDKLLLVRAFFLVAAIRLGLWLLQFRVLRRLSLPSESSSNGAPWMDRLIWAVQVVSRYIPRATCLTQALAAQALLARSEEKKIKK